MSRQLSFDLPAKPALGRDDFYVAPANALAVAMIDKTDLWPGRKLVLFGPAGAGKTHLAHVWAQTNGATMCAARDLASADVPALAQGPVVVEDVPCIAQDRTTQEALFHLHNLVLAEGHSLLMTGRGEPVHWGMTLPDLQSRIAGSQSVALSPPDDALLGAVLVKLFQDRQVIPRPDVIPYLVTHMDRSFAAAARIVERMDQIALEEGRSLTRALAARLLGAQGEIG